MIFLTHIAFALFLAAASLVSWHPAVSPYVFSAIILLSAMLPDIDIATSTIGKKARPLSYFLEHRGFFHSILFMVIVSVVIYATSKTAAYSAAFIIGFGSHISLDSLNPSGVMLFWPLRKKFKGFIRTGRIFDLALFAIFSTLTLLILFFYFRKIF